MMNQDTDTERWRRPDLAARPETDLERFERWTRGEDCDDPRALGALVLRKLATAEKALEDSAALIARLSAYENGEDD